MDLDPNELYRRQQEHEAYVQKQKDNHIDLSEGLDNPNESVRLFAEHLFNKDYRYLSKDMCGMLLDITETPVADIFCILLELFLYGFDIKTKKLKTVFDLTESTDDLIYDLRPYIKSIGFILKIEELFDEDTNVNLYRDRDDYYCQIARKPPPFMDFSIDKWNVLDYRLIPNRKFEFSVLTGLTGFSAFFINKEKRIFIVKFNIDLGQP
jgi:hypothetical protein